MSFTLTSLRLFWRNWGFRVKSGFQETTVTWTWWFTPVVPKELNEEKRIKVTFEWILVSRNFDISVIWLNSKVFLHKTGCKKWWYPVVEIRKSFDVRDSDFTDKNGLKRVYSSLLTQMKIIFKQSTFRTIRWNGSKKLFNKAWFNAIHI